MPDTTTGRRGRSWPARVLVAAAVALVLPATPASGAPADPVCGRQVTDQAGVLDDKVVRAAARQVEAHGVDVRVVTYRRVPHRDLLAHLKAQQASCESWQGQRGGWKNDLVVLAVSVDDLASGLYYPDSFENELGSHWRVIQLRRMNPHFGRGDYTGGMVAGLSQVGRLVDPDRTASVSPKGAKPASDAGPTEPADNPAASTGRLPHWVVAVPLGVAGLGGLTWVGVVTGRRLRRREAARAAALAAVDTVTAAFAALDGAREAALARIDALPRVDDVRVTAIRGRFGATAAQVSAVVDTYLQQEEEYVASTLARMDTADATAAARTMYATADTMAHLVGELEQVERELDELESLRASLPARIGKIRETTDEVELLLSRRREEGFLVDAYAAELPRIEQSCAEAEGLLEQMRVSDVSTLADDLAHDAQELHAAVDVLPARQQQLRADLEALRAAQKQCGLLLRGAMAVTERLEATRHASCTDDVRGLVAQARSRLADLPGLLDQLDRASSMEVQDLASAEECAARLRSMVGEIEANCAAPVRRRDHLGALDASLPTSREAVATALERLARTASSNRAALRFLERPLALEELARDLDDLAPELEKAMPRLLWLADELSRLGSAVEAEQDHLERGIRAYEQVERLVLLARSEVSSATSATDRPNAGFQARGLADDALELLHEAESAGDLGTRHAKASEAVAVAKKAARAIRRHRTSSGMSGSTSGGGPSRF